VDPLFRERYFDHLLRGIERIRSSAAGRKQSGTLLQRSEAVLHADNTQNRMMESLVLFDSVVNSRWFMRTSIVLFLNKVDLFRAKLPKSPLGNYFPDYSGGNDVNRAAKYLLWRFNQVNRAHLNLYPQ
jgi:guanine nucleotide-binding protein subunit alpha